MTFVTSDDLDAAIHTRFAELEVLHDFENMPEWQYNRIINKMSDAIAFYMEPFLKAHDAAKRSHLRLVK